MPGALIERPKMTRGMYQALKRHIMQEREKKKQEQEQDEAMERLKKEREMRKKKEEEDSLTLEQTKEQIGQLESKLETLKQEKHELFSQLKKVLHQEDESRKRAQIKDQSDMLMSQQYAQAGMQVPGHPMLLQGGVARPGKYMTIHQPIVPGGIKRPRSPSPPPSTMYSPYSANGGKYPPTSYAPTVKQEPYAGPVKQEPNYPPQHSQSAPVHRPVSTAKQGSYPTTGGTQVTYVTQSGHTYQPPQQQQQPPQQQSTSYPASQSPAGGKYTPANQSAFSSYPAHYAHQQKQIPDHYPQGYPNQVHAQRMSQPHTQPGYMGSPHTGSSIPLQVQQQLEHGSQKSGFSEEKFKMQQQQIRGMAPLPQQGQQGILPSQIPMSQHQPATSQASSQPPKGSIVTGYPIRTQTTTSAYQPTSSQSIYSQQGVPPRHSYPGQPPGRGYY